MKKSPITKIIKKTLPAVVSITVSKYLTVFEKTFGYSPLGLKDFLMIPKGKRMVKVGGGSGFIINSSGIILTNRHVVNDPAAEYLVVLNNGKKYKTEILAKDPIDDVAVLKINAKNLPTVKLGDSSKLELGESVIAIGNTLGTFRNTVSAGIVSGLSRQINATNNSNQEVQQLRGLIQTDAAVNPGNSGGPLINMEGKAIGINAAMVFEAENVGFALPINAAKRDIKDLKKFGKIRRPFLGIRYISLDEDFQQKHNLSLNHGALVASETGPNTPAIIPGSPAKVSGVKEGDIILAAEKEIISKENSLENILQKFKIGQSISLKILRHNKTISLKIKIGER